VLRGAWSANVFASGPLRKALSQKEKVAIHNRLLIFSKLATNDGPGSCMEELHAAVKLRQKRSGGCSYYIAHPLVRWLKVTETRENFGEEAQHSR
jgi:hypothetical protein